MTSTFFPFEGEASSQAASPYKMRSVSVRASREEILAHLRDMPVVENVQFELIGETIDGEVTWLCRRNGSWIMRGDLRLVEGPPRRGLEIRASINESEVSVKESDHILLRWLRAAKQMIEVGEIATIEGQTHGHARRSRFWEWLKS